MKYGGGDILNTSDTRRLTTRLSKDLYEKLYKISKEEQDTMSNLVRTYIEEGLGIKLGIADIEKLNELISRNMEIVVGRRIDRIIKLNVKNLIKLNKVDIITTQLFKQYYNGNAEEELEKAEKQAVLLATNKVK